MNEQALTVQGHAPVDIVGGAMDIQTLAAQVKLITQCMKEVMQVDVHYGRIPGTSKDCLYKAGAEKLLFMFRLRPIVDPRVDVTTEELGGGHKLFTVVTHVLTQDGVEVATGIGSCSTKEGKYLYRHGEEETELTGEKIPTDYKENKSKYRKQGFVCKKVDSAWGWYKITGSADKVEHDNPADYWNTCLKMAKKRSMVDGALTGLAASDVLTQDVEDMQGVIDREEEKNPTPSPTTAPTTAATVPPPTTVQPLATPPQQAPAATTPAPSPTPAAPPAQAPQQAAPAPAQATAPVAAPAPAAQAAPPTQPLVQEEPGATEPDEVLPPAQPDGRPPYATAVHKGTKPPQDQIDKVISTFSDYGLTKNDLHWHRGMDNEWLESDMAWFRDKFMALRKAEGPEFDKLHASLKAPAE